MKHEAVKLLGVLVGSELSIGDSASGLSVLAGLGASAWLNLLNYMLLLERKGWRG